MFQSDEKKKAILLKNRARELGYDMKLTHAQEIIAKLNGHNNRHSFLKKSSGKIKNSFSMNLDLDHIIKSEELEIIKSPEFKEKLEASFFHLVLQTVNNLLENEKVDPHEKQSINDSGSSVFNFSYKKSANPLLTLYQNALQSGKFVNNLFLGFKDTTDGKVDIHQKNVHQSGNSIFIGNMGSGKSVSAFSSVLTYFLANSENTQLFLTGLQKGCYDFHQLVKYEQSALVQESEFETLITNLYDQLIVRKIVTDKSIQKVDLPTILTVIEDFHVFSHQYNYEKEKNTIGSIAYKLKEILKMGPTLGIIIFACGQSVTSDNLPNDFNILFQNKMMFRCARSESMHILGHDKAGYIKQIQQGRCFSENNEIQFPYIDRENAIILLTKYYKPFNKKWQDSPYIIKKDFIKG